MDLLMKNASIIDGSGADAFRGCICGYNGHPGEYLEMTHLKVENLNVFFTTPDGVVEHLVAGGSLGGQQKTFLYVCFFYQLTFQPGRAHCEEPLRHHGPSNRMKKGLAVYDLNNR